MVEFKNIISSIIFLSIFAIALSKKDDKKSNKYSKEANVPSLDNYEPDFRTLKDPFRIMKVNLVWSKAQHRLTEPKLKSLFTELKIHDKEELKWKQLNSEHQDKDGLKANELRLKLVGIMSTYGLLEHFDDTQDPEKYKHHKNKYDTKDNYKNKSLFKDKKLNKLWEKAEVAGFTPEEMDTLKEEFHHHQSKIDMYYELLEKLDEGDDGKHENAVNEEDLDKFNEIMAAENNDGKDLKIPKHQEYVHKANQLRDKHQEIRDNFDRLDRAASQGPKSTDFVEPKIQGLWRAALAGDFSPQELASLKVELLHYESRLMKLRHLHAEHALQKEKYKSKLVGKEDNFDHLEQNIKKQTRKVEKIHEEMERRVFKHLEL